LDGGDTHGRRSLSLSLRVKVHSPFMLLLGVAEGPHPPLIQINVGRVIRH
jgi:hypothetical protein